MRVKYFLIVSMLFAVAQATQFSVDYDEQEQSVVLKSANGGSFVISDSVLRSKLEPIQELIDLPRVSEIRDLQPDDILTLISDDNLRVVESGVGLYVADVSAQNGRLMMTYDVRNCHCIILKSKNSKKAGMIHLRESDFVGKTDPLSLMLKNFDPQQTDVFLLTSWVTNITAQLSSYLSTKGFVPTHFSSKQAFLADPYGQRPIKYMPFDSIGVSNFSEAKSRGINFNQDYFRDRAFGLDTATGEVFELSNLAFQAVYEQKNLLSPSQAVKLSRISLDDHKKSIVRANQSSGQLRIAQLKPKASK